MFIYRVSAHHRADRASSTRQITQRVTQSLIGGGEASVSHSLCLYLMYWAAMESCCVATVWSQRQSSWWARMSGPQCPATLCDGLALRHSAIPLLGYYTLHSAFRRRALWCSLFDPPYRRTDYWAKRENGAHWCARHSAFIQQHRSACHGNRFTASTSAIHRITMYLHTYIYIYILYCVGLYNNTYIKKERARWLLYSRFSARLPLAAASCAI